MGKTIKILCICLAVISLFMVFASCVGNPEEQTTPTVSPSIVIEPNSYEDMQTDIATGKAGVLIFSIDDYGSVTFPNGEQCSMAEAYSQIGDAVPAVRVETSAQATALAAYLKESQSVDFFVLSSQSDLIETVKESWPTVRGVYDVSSRSFNDYACGYTLAGEVCSAQSQAVILPSGVSRNFVTEVQARSVLVWILSESDFEIWSAALTGCYGIVNSSVSSLVSVLEQFDENTVWRSPYLVGHRGYPEKYNENSVEGVTEAFRVGATHVEIDVHLTADKEILVMHDFTIDATTNGYGYISEMTLNEIRRYKLDDNYLTAGYSEIPVLSDILDVLLEEEFSDKILIIEIKVNSSELVSKIAELLDNEKYSNVRERLLFVTFYENLLNNLAETFSDIPRGFLGSINTDDYLSRLSPTNSFINSEVNSGWVNASTSERLKDYGYAVWAWAYEEDFTIQTVYETGVIGFMTNYAGNFSDYVSNLYTPSVIDNDLTKNGAKVIAIHYDGAVCTISGIWKAVDDKTGVFCCECVDSVSGLSLVFYTEFVVITN